MPIKRGSLKKQQRTQKSVRKRIAPKPRKRVSRGPVNDDGPTPQKTGNSNFPIIGIGASAGGLAAFKSFLGALQPDSDMAFVLVQHLDPTHESLTAEILAKCTAMKVMPIGDKMPILPNSVYVIPPNKYVALEGQRLRLTAPVERRGIRTPIDFFFRSLADVQQENAVGIILSGTGSDGTLGITAIKGHGGMTMVQVPETTPYDGMPRSAIATGLVDYILPIGEMPRVLLRYLNHASKNELVRTDAQKDRSANRIDAILTLLRVQKKFDFRGYRKGTLTRRVARRMSVHHIEQTSDYELLLRSDPVEVAALSQDLLIGVTRFFREPAAFKVLADRIIPQIIRGLKGDEPLRVWIPGCASGEEPYSVAMLLVEQLDVAKKTNEIHVFATDVNENALTIARTGSYPESVAADISAERLERFFQHTGTQFRVGERLRKTVVFAVQNLIVDPPFSSMHMVVCRNLLIYIEPELQRKVIPLFHFALKEGGFLFLGNTESIGEHTDLFETVTRKWRLFKRTGPVRPNKIAFPTNVRVARFTSDTNPPVVRRNTDLSAIVREQLLADYAPAAVLINRKFEILYFFGATGRYLNQPTGDPTHDLLALAAEGLRAKLRAVIKQAIAKDERVSLAEVRFRRKNKSYTVDVTAKPLKMPASVAGLFLVSFQDSPPASADNRTITPHSRLDEALVHQLEYELKSTRSELQNTIEDQEATNEELKASNEEMMSMNEELQSSNEELETSKEELQSLNEELSTVNNELQEKNEELWAINNDINNLLGSTEIATLFLDMDLRIRRFTPATTGIFSLIPADIGRSIQDISHRFTGEDTLIQDVKSVLGKLTPIERERHTDDGADYIQRASLYQIQDNRIGGVVITFVDIRKLKQAQETSHAARVFAENIVDTIREPLLILDTDLRVVSANRSFYTFFRSTAEQTEGRIVYELGHQQWDIPFLRNALNELLTGHDEFHNYELAHDFPEIGRRSMILNGRKIISDHIDRKLILLAMEDATERRQAIDALHEEKERAQVTLHSIGDGVIRINVTGIVEYLNPIAESLTGLSLHQARGRSIDRVFRLAGEKDHLPVQDALAPVFAGVVDRIGLDQSNFFIDTHGVERSVEYTAAAIRDTQGRPNGAVLVFRDVTEARKIVTEIARQATHDTMTGLVNRRAFELRLQQLLDTAKQGPSEHAMCYLDLDQFKVINDTCGHLAGDQLLRELSAMLQDQVRRQDMLARLGGDEFGILMEQCPLNQAKRVADNLRHAIEKFRFQWEGKSFSVGASIGLVPINEFSDNVTEIFKAADAACYAAKDEGRNRVHLFQANDVDTAKRHGQMHWVARINNALESNLFSLNCQRIVPLRPLNTGPDAYEVLLTLTDDGNQHVSPGDFLPAAERYNLCTKLDRWVVDSTLQWLSRNPASLDHLLLCCINLSGQSIGDSLFLDFLIDRFRETRVAPEKVCFEVTETAVISDLPKAIRFMTKLKSLGCRFSLDDFGIGLSSFQYLKMLPVDYVKIDGLFVKDVVNDPVQLALVKSINDICQTMGKETIAEFVESELILQKIEGIGINFAQGYALGRPRPIDSLAQ